MTPRELRHHIPLDFSSFHDTGGAPTAYCVRLLIISCHRVCSDSIFRETSHHFMTPGVLRQHISLDFPSLHDTEGAPTAYSSDFSSFHDTGGAPTAYFVRLLIIS